MSRIRNSYLSAVSRLVRAMPFQKGRLRVVHHLTRVVSSEREVVVFDRFGNKLYAPSVAEPIVQHVLAYGVYEDDVVHLLAELLAQESGVLVDVGANIGCHSLALARLADAQVLAIEASPKVFAYLERNILANEMDRVRVLNAAATCDSRRKVTFYEAPTSKFGMGSRGPQFGARPIEVAAVNLDDVCQGMPESSATVIKIDVEGFELDVLRGGCEFLERRRPTVVMEFCDWAEARTGKIGAAQRYLLQRGYVLFRLGDQDNPGAALSEPITSGFEMIVARPCL